MIDVKSNSVFRFVQKNNAVLILFLVFAVAALTANAKFLKASNFYNLSQTIGTFSIFAAGLSFVFIVGSIDLSIGYQVAFCATIFAIVSPSLGFMFTIPIVLLMGIIIGYINGTIVTRLKIPSLIGTLAVMTILKGVVLLLNNDKGGKSVRKVLLFGASLPDFYKLQIFGFLAPSVIIAFLLLQTFAVFLKWTRSGADMYVTGGNPEAASLSGIDNGRLTRFAYSICGFCSAVCSILLVMRNNASTYNMGDNIDITAICAVVIGGIKMTGGKGTMGMCLMGVAIIQIINNLMIKLGLHSSMQSFITGIIVVMVLIINKLTAQQT
jgi:ribose transport system permease protein